MPLEPALIYAPLALRDTLYLIVNTLATPTLKNVPRSLHVTCKSGGDADFCRAPPPTKNKKICLLITPLLLI